MKKYSKVVIRDIKWYLSVRHLFNFDGIKEYYNKKGLPIVVYSKEGMDGIESFYRWDSQGIIVPTKHPLLFKTLLKTKGSVNLHIKMYSEDRENGLLSKFELEEMCKLWDSPPWFFEAIEKSKHNMALISN